jgi:hypothetical protein
MAIRIEDVAGTDFSDVAGAERIGPVTPGEVLRESSWCRSVCRLVPWHASWACRRTASPQSWLATAALPPRRYLVWRAVRHIGEFAQSPDDARAGGSAAAHARAA